MSRKANWLLVLVMALVPLLALTLTARATDTTYPIPFLENFDTQTQPWSLGGLWNVVDESEKLTACKNKPGIKVPSNNPDTGNAAWFGDISNCTYDYSGTLKFGALVSPVIEVQTGASAADMQFDYFLQVEYYAKGGYDKTYVEYRTSLDNSTWGPWTQLWYRDSKDTFTATNFVPTGWLPIPAPSAYTGNGPWYLQVQFVFDSVDAYANNFLGWEIDNIKIVSSAPAGLTITDTNIPECIAGGKNYSHIFTAIGGVPPYVWLARDLPLELELNPDTGELSGTCPEEPGQYPFEIMVKDSREEYTTKKFILVVEYSPTGEAVFFQDLENLVQTDSNKWDSTEGRWELADPTQAYAQAYTTTNLWHPVDNTKCLTPGYSSPTHAFYYGRDKSCNYYTQGNANKGSLVFTPGSGHQPSAGQFYTLGFKYYRSVESYGSPPTSPPANYDRTDVWVSWDNGGTWTRVFYLDSGMANNAPLIGIPLMPGSAQNAGNGWWYAEIPLVAPSSVSGFKVKFTFDTVDNFNNQHLGWLIDDVKLLGAVAACTCTLTPTSMPNGTVGTPYTTQNLTAGNCVGGTPSGNWTWSPSGSVPPGLALGASNTNTNTFGGTPTTAGTYTFTITATNSASGCTASRQYTVEITAAGGVEWCETFEGAGGYDHAGWTASGLWHVVSQTDKAGLCGQQYPNVTPFPSLTHDAWYGDLQAPGCTYNTGGANSGNLISPAIPVTPGNWTLNFKSYLDVEQLAAFDLAKVYYSFTSNAGPWTEIWSKAAPYNEWATIGGLNITVPAGTTQMWLRFYFNTADAILNNTLGWEVDNICVTPVVGGSSLSAAVPLAVSQVLAFPNPVKDINTMTFLVEGQGIAGLEVEVFNLAGKRVFSSGLVKGNQLTWHLTNDKGLLVANGVYLYVVTVRGWDGTTVKSKVQKLVVLR